MFQSYVIRSLGLLRFLDVEFRLFETDDDILHFLTLFGVLKGLGKRIESGLLLFSKCHQIRLQSGQTFAACGVHSFRVS